MHSYTKILMHSNNVHCQLQINNDYNQSKKTITINQSINQSINQLEFLYVAK